ncbi:MAG TPA: diguanylate cyclase [Polyangiaceae bacterium]
MQSHNLYRPDAPRDAGPRPLGSIARDLRAAAVSMRDGASVLLGAGHDEDDHGRVVRAIESQLRRLDQLIQELGSRGLELPVGPALTLSPPRVAHRSRPRVLIADDDLDGLETLASLLAEDYEVAMAHDGHEALDRLRADEFDLAILDQQMPGLSGLEVAERLTVEVSTPPAFMFLSGESDARLRVKGLSLGAADFVTKPMHPDELLARVERILRTVWRERSLAADTLVDALTGLANYRSLARNLELELDRAHRYDLPVSLLMIDLDGLKSINDDLGHGAGDDAIRLVGSTLHAAVRRFETVARQGGDEFSILLPNTSEPAAMLLGERLRQEVSECFIGGRRLSISVGVGSREPGDEATSVRTLVDRSDAALYRSKRAGRNRVSGRPAP